MKSSVKRWGLAGVLAMASLGCSNDKDNRTYTGTGESWSALIGPRGGVVEGKGVSLSVPENALKSETLIEIASSREALTGEIASFSPVYRFSPSGLLFARPAEVRVDFKGSPDHARVFWSDSGESRFEELETTVEAATARARVTHFSLGFVGDGESSGTPSGAGGAGGMTGDPGNPMGSGGASNDTGGAGGMTGDPGDPMSSGGAPNDGGEEICRPLDLFVLVQATASMNEESSTTFGTWWELITDQLNSFFGMARNEGIRVGLTFIGGPDASVPCNASAYERLDVALGKLPGHVSTLALALDERDVAGGTALSEAFEGMVGIARASAQSNPTHATAILFVTNATATACNTSNGVAATAQLASATYALNIPTVVAGVGMEYSALQQIAAAGGTQHAFLLDASDSVYDLSDFFATVRACTR